MPPPVASLLYKKLTVPQLRRLCQQYGISDKGLQQELIDRLGWMLIYTLI